MARNERVECTVFALCPDRYVVFYWFLSTVPVPHVSWEHKKQSVQTWFNLIKHSGVHCHVTGRQWL